MNDLDQIIKKYDRLIEIYPEDQEIKNYRDKLVLLNTKKREVQVH